MFKNLLHLVKQSRSAIARKILPEILFYSSRINLFPNEFVRSSHTFLQFLKRSNLSPVNTQGSPVGIIVSPWLCTAVPWYSITIAIGLAKKGKHIILIWDDSFFPEPSVDLRIQNLCIGYVLDYISKFLSVIRLSLERSAPDREEDQQHLYKLADLNLIWYSRAESLTSTDLNQRSAYQHKLSQVLPLTRKLLSRIKFEYLLVPGGIYGSSSLFMYTAKEKDIRVATYDGGAGCLFCCSEGIAAHQSDIPIAFTKLWHSSTETKQKAIGIAKQEFHDRTEGKDYFCTQVIGTQQQITTAFSTDVLIPLNLEWDSAALGKHYLFENTIEWLLETINFILANSNKTVVVRQHPAERFPFCQSLLDLEIILHQHFGHHGRFHFINARQEINTYNLLESSSLVLPFVSTVGLEAAAMNKNVLISGYSYYKDLGFVWAANSRQEYFDILLNALNSLLPNLPDQQDRAWLCYYLTQICNLTFTRYNPELKDFWYWGNQEPRELFEDTVVTDLLTAIDTDTPFSWIRHCRNINSNI